MKPSKKVLDLRSKEKILVRQKQYLEAEKIKRQAHKLEMKERERKND